MSTTTASTPTRRRTPAPRGGASQPAAPTRRGTVVLPARPRATTRPGGRLTTYGPVTTGGTRGRGPSCGPTPAQVRTRVGAALSVLALLGVLLVVGVAHLLAPGTPGVPVSTAVVQVQPGDTLSGIAAERAPDAPRQAVVDRIVELNGLGSPALRPGQTLTVPAAATAVR